MNKVVKSLVITQLATIPNDILTSVVLIDIGLTFERSVGEMGQIFTVNSIAAMVTALLMSILSIRYSRKLLLVFGVGLIVSSSLGCFLAPSYIVMLIVYPLTGIGVVMVHSMAMALVGEHLPVEKRSSAIGFIFGSPFVLGVVSGPIVGIITGWGWRLAFLGYALPISLVCLVIAIIGIPSDTTRSIESRYVKAFKKVLSNRSAVACLIGTILFNVAFVSLVFSFSFFRQKFSVPIGWVGVYMAGLSICYVLGSISSGKIVGKFEIDRSISVAFIELS